MTPDGDAVVVLPQRAPASAAHQLVAQHADWVRRHVARAREQHNRLAARPSIWAGRPLLIGGVPHLVALDAAAAGRASRGRVDVRAVAASGDTIGADSPACLIRVRLGTDGRTPADLLESWLRGRARDALVASIAVRSASMGVTPTGLAIRDQRSRWGSASRSGRLSMNWRLVLAPPWVLDYVVVHELAHLRVPGHPAAFWAIVRGAYPAADDARRWLRERGAGLLHELE